MLNAPSPVARTPLHHWHAAHGARFADLDGWQVVAGYGALEREVAAARGGLGLADISAFKKINLHGPGVPASGHPFPTPRLSSRAAWLHYRWEPACPAG
jgi:hypothetical protein